MSENANSHVSPKGRPAAEAATGRARRSGEYREARDEYVAIRQLCERNWIAAHIRERRYELDLTQQEVGSGPAPRIPSSRSWRAASTSPPSRSSSESSPYSTRSY